MEEASVSVPRRTEPDAIIILQLHLTPTPCAQTDKQSNPTSQRTAAQIETQTILLNLTFKNEHDHPTRGSGRARLRFSPSKFHAFEANDAARDQRRYRPLCAWLSSRFEPEVVQVAAVLSRKHFKNHTNDKTKLEEGAEIASLFSNT